MWVELGSWSGCGVERLGIVVRAKLVRGGIKGVELCCSVTERGAWVEKELASGQRK